MKRQAVVPPPPIGGGGGEADEDKEHKFWDTQPMPHERRGQNGSGPSSMISAVTPEGAEGAPPPGTTREHCPIVPDKPKSELRQEPYNMPRGFEWSDVNINDEAQREEVYDLLARNYVEDDDCQFRFDYSPNFLMWALTPPGYDAAFHLGVRSSKSGKLMALITGVPAKVRAYESSVDMVEINFLCVHKKLRSKRLAPVLIKEITRRVNHTGVFQAVYTAGVVLPVPVSSCQYFHRSLNPKKLVDVGFSRLPPRMTMARMIKLFKVPAKTLTPNLREMTAEDVPSAHRLLMKHLEKFKLAVMFTEAEFAHWLLPREGVVNSYVAADPETNEVTDLCSFYHIPSTILGHPQHKNLFAAYSFYNVAGTVSLEDLMRDALVLARQNGLDVFNALNLMENATFLEELKFGPGDGRLQYYLYNWACPVMESKDVGIVML